MKEVTLKYQATLGKFLLYGIMSLFPLYMTGFSISQAVVQRELSFLLVAFPFLFFSLLLIWEGFKGIFVVAVRIDITGIYPVYSFKRWLPRSNQVIKWGKIKKIKFHSQTENHHSTHNYWAYLDIELLSGEKLNYKWQGIDEESAKRFKGYLKEITSNRGNLL